MSKALTPRQARPAARSMSPRPKSDKPANTTISVRLDDDTMAVLNRLSDETEHTVGKLARKYILKGLQADGLIKKILKKD